MTTREPARAGWLALFHSSVFAVFPVLTLLSATVGMFPIRADLAARPLIAGLTLNALLFLGLRPVVPPASQRGALLTVAYVGLHLHVVTSTWNDETVLTWVPAALLAALHVAVSLALVVIVWRSGPQATRTRLLAAAATVLLVSNVVLAGVARLQVGTGEWRGQVETITRGGRFTLAPGGPRPDIVHVVFDGLGSPRVLREFYGLDTRRWTGAMESAGFAVADDAHSNYVHTYSSMASLLSAAYLDGLERQLGDRFTRIPLRAVIENSGVIRSLRDAGYDFTLIGSPYSATDSHPLATRCDCAVPPMAELEAALLRSSVLRTVALPWLTYEPYRQRLFHQLDAVRSLPVTGPPHYTLAHVVSPHPPFAFDEDGALPSGPRPVFGLLDGSDFPGSREQYRAGYRAQATFILEQLTDLARRLRARPRPTAVVITGDHGPGLLLDHEDAGQSNLRERFGTFFAIHVPGRTVTLPDGFSLVNTYRLLAREALDARIDLLPDRSYFTTFSEPYRFVRVDARTVLAHGVSP